MRFAPNLASRFPTLATLIALASLPLAATAASPMLPGLWELRITTTVAKQTAPAETLRECLSQQDVDHPTRTLPKPGADCALSSIETQGNRTTYDIACTRSELTNRGRMELVTSSTHYDGMADMKVSAPGKTDTAMTVMVNAKRVGDCQK